jgi:hypothetical protein
MNGAFDITIYPAENGYQVTLDRYDSNTPTRRYNAADVEEVLTWVGETLRALEKTPKGTP